MRIFFILPRVPYPTEKGDKLRAFHQIRELAARHEIILCALNDGDLHQNAIPVLKKYAKAVHVIPISRISILFSLIRTLFSRKPLQVGYFYHRSAASRIKALIREYQPDHIFCQLIRVAEYARDLNIPKTLDYQDVFSKGMERRLATSPFYLKPFLRLEYQRLLRYEHDIFEAFDNKIIISAPDRDLIPHPDRARIQVVANGVDTGFFRPVDQPRNVDLVFTGNMGYPPNIRSAEFLVNDILPEVLKKRPGIRLLIAGANPHLRVMSLRSAQVEVSGWVADIRESYARARIFIAPMQIGTGLQNKLLEAMAMRLPCITSPLAFQALNAREGEEILVAGTPAEYAAHILYLLDNPQKADEIAGKGYDFVHRNFSWARETEKIEKLMMESVR
ncbi:MAG TPA: glycosyltransferase [Bacteroidales bacterium]|nr:glycosyltransferase [Bacteroidales bacterium]HPS62516.1 glycosyltransferase [Bacteroidales bacterium]